MSLKLKTENEVSIYLNSITDISFDVLGEETDLFEVVTAYNPNTNCHSC
jgi:hypothetical protein